MGRADERFGAAAHLGALHELDLGAVEIYIVLAVNRALAEIQFAGEHHLARGKKLWRGLVNEPSLNEKPETNGQDRNPPAAQEQRSIAIEPRDERITPRGGRRAILDRGLHRLHVDQTLRNVDLIVRLQDHIFVRAAFLDHALQIHYEILAVLARY